jgi:hypothetical protein
MPALAGKAFGADSISNNDGLTLPDGFSAVVVQEGQGTGRHLTVAANGDVYLAGSNGLSALRDTNGDGKADVVTPFGDVKGTEVRIFKNWLYVSDDVGVYRYPLKKGELAPTGTRRPWSANFPKSVSTQTRPLRSIPRALFM